MSFFPSLNYRFYGDQNEGVETRKKKTFKKLVSCDPDEAWKLFRLLILETIYPEFDDLTPVPFVGPSVLDFKLHTVLAKIKGCRKREDNCYEVVGNLKNLLNANSEVEAKKLGEEFLTLDDDRTCGFKREKPWALLQANITGIGIIWGSHRKRIQKLVLDTEKLQKIDKIYIIEKVYYMEKFNLSIDIGDDKSVPIKPCSFNKEGSIVSRPAPFAFLCCKYNVMKDGSLFKDEKATLNDLRRTLNWKGFQQQSYQQWDAIPTVYEDEIESIMDKSNKANTSFGEYLDLTLEK